MGRLLALAWVLLRHGALIGLVDRRDPRPAAPAGGPGGRALAGRPSGPALGGGAHPHGAELRQTGPILATRGDLLGAEIADDLAYLQDRMAPFPAAEARRALRPNLAGR